MKKHQTSTMRNPSKHLFNFEGWEKLDGKDFHELKNKAHSFYYSNTADKDLVDLVWDWMLLNGYNKVDIHNAKKASGTDSISSTIGVLCKLLLSGCPDFNEKHNQYWQTLKGTAGNIKPISSHIHHYVKRAIAVGKEIIEEVVDENKPSVNIQERMVELLDPILCTFEAYVDEWLDGKSIKDFDPYKEMLSYEPKIKATHARIIREKFKSLYEEAKEVVAGTDEDLNEGYGHLNVKRKKEFLAIYQMIDDACDMIIRSGQATRKQRKPKAVSLEKQVSGLRYKEIDPEFNLVSINPINIVGASELWVYNTKTRKLGYYIADPLIKSLSVKGSSINTIGSSSSKTLRKPREQLKYFMGLNKSAMKKYFDEIKTSETSLSPRLSADTIILLTK
jgi:hypothetical protein